MDPSGQFSQAFLFDFYLPKLFQIMLLREVHRDSIYRGELSRWLSDDLNRLLPPLNANFIIPILAPMELESIPNMRQLSFTPVKVGLAREVPAVRGPLVRPAQLGLMLILEKGLRSHSLELKVVTKAIRVIAVVLVPDVTELSVWHHEERPRPVRSIRIKSDRMRDLV
jgi:hypothetical protein